MKDPLSRLLGAELGRVPRLQPRTVPRLSGSGAGAPPLLEEHVEREWVNGAPTGVVHTRHVDALTGKSIEPGSLSQSVRQGQSVAPQSVQRKASASVTEPLTRDAASSVSGPGVFAKRPAPEPPTRLAVSPASPVYGVVPPEVDRPLGAASASMQVEPAASAVLPTIETVLTELDAPAHERPSAPRVPASRGATELASELTRTAGVSPGVPRDSAIAAGAQRTAQDIPALQTPPSWSAAGEGGALLEIPALQTPPVRESASRELQQSDSNPARDLQSRSVTTESSPSFVPDAAPLSRTSPASPAAAPPLVSIAPLAAAQVIHEAARGSMPALDSAARPGAVLSSARVPEIRDDPTRVQSSSPERSTVEEPERAGAQLPVPTLGFGLGPGGLAEAIRAYAASASASTSASTSASDAPGLSEPRMATSSPSTTTSTPAVRIRIGRLEVHAHAAAAPATPQVERPHQGLSLEALLRLREES